LRQFSFQTLKIDRNFVADITLDAEGGGGLRKELISLAHNLDLSVIAEAWNEAINVHSSPLKAAIRSKATWPAGPCPLARWQRFSS
jgi:predicted signal transduction protein with EAL and GGDEF domain